MKKKMLMMAALLCCLMGFTACGSDDEPDPTATITYTLDFSDDVFKVVDYVAVTYINGAGEEKEAIATSSPWTRTITTNSYPARLGCKLNLAKSSVEESALTQDSYDITVVGHIQYSINGEGQPWHWPDDLSGTGIKKSDVLSFLKKNSPWSMAMILNSDGSFSKSSL